MLQKKNWASLKNMTPDEIDAYALALLEQMPLQDKARQLAGDESMFQMGLHFLRDRRYNATPYEAGSDPEWEIEPLRFVDGPRGIVAGHSTIFPVSMARGASFDVNLEERIGDVIGIEGRIQGGNFFGGVCINLLRHPAWGRAQETYGEDSYHLGEMGAALVRGVQRHMMACAKHYACNSMENMRFKVNVKVSERTLREVYLPHFKRCVDEGVASIMSAYNQVNGEYCGHNAPLLRRILKEEWGFKGFVVSDFIWGVRDGEKAIQGGMDVEMPRHQHMSVKAVTRLVKAGKVSEAQIDEAALRHIRTKMHFARVGIPEGYPAEQLCCRTHTDLAREAAEKSIVLLKNNGILPLDGTKMKKVAVFGKLANTPNTGDHGSSNGAPPYVITPLEGLTQVLSAETKLHYNQDFDHAAAQDADACIVVVGYTHKEEGEYMSGITKIGGDRSSLSLPPRNIALIQAVASANPRSVVVLEGGSAIITEEWRQQAAAILMAWYPGMEGGNALAGILFGKVNPSGKLPCVFPKSTHQLPYFDRMAEEIDYGYWHGYRLMERKGHAPAFHFGFGLSYTTFSVNHLQLEQTELKTNQVLKAKVHLQNTGTRDGAEIVQVYVGSPGMIVERPIKDLKGFQRIHLKAGESCWVDFSIDLQTLAYWDDNFHDWLIESGEYILFVGTSADPQDLLMSKFTIQIPS